MTLSTLQAQTPAQANYRWSPDCQINFLSCLAETGSIAQAAEAAGKSRRAAYNLRFRSDGAAFRIGWDAAILVARATLADTLMERAISGQEDVSVRDPDTNTVTRHRIDNRLGMSLLSRLDRMAETPNDACFRPTETGLARLVSQDFEAFLALIERGGCGAEAALFVAARSPDDVGDGNTSGQCELEDVAPPKAAPPKAAPVIEEEEEWGGMVEFWGEESGWYTSFPPPPGFDGKEYEVFGTNDYERALSPAEAAVHLARVAEKRDREIAIAAAERDAYFGFTPEAVVVA